MKNSSIHNLIDDVLTNSKGNPRRRITLLFLFLIKRDSRFWWAFVNFNKFGFTELTYRGIPIVMRDDVPEDEFLMRQKDNTWKRVNMKTRRVGTLKNVEDNNKTG